VCAQRVTSITVQPCDCGINCFACEYLPDNTAGRCMRCKNSKYLVDGKCLDVCPRNTQPVGTGSFDRSCSKSIAICPDRSAPLTKPTVSTPVFCGRGLEREDCPPTTHQCYIHEADLFAICCPLTSSAPQVSPGSSTVVSSEAKAEGVYVSSAGADSGASAGRVSGTSARTFAIVCAGAVAAVVLVGGFAGLWVRQALREGSYPVSSTS
jgi:hypothetical protein